MKIAVIHDYADVLRTTRAYQRLHGHDVVIHTDAYTEPAPGTTDAVMALDMDTGKRLWVVQDTENDAWLVGCAQDRSDNCPQKLGPDFDFGAPPILRTLPNGLKVVLLPVTAVPTFDARLVFASIDVRFILARSVAFTMP